MNGVLFESFLVVLFAEMGDKSQLLMVAMTAEYTVRQILCGTLLAVLCLSALAVTLGALLGELLPTAAVSLIAGAAFLWFSLQSVRQDGEEETLHRGRRGAVFAVFCTYFLSELGDKTQLASLTLSAGGAGDVWSRAIPVFLGSSAALLVADLLGLSVGVLLGRRLPQAYFGALSAVLFFACGVLRLLDGFSELLGITAHPSLYSAFATLPIALPIGIGMLFGIKKLIKKEGFL